MGGGPRLIAPFLAFAILAYAGPSAAEGQADTLFNEGRDLLEKGRFSEACAKLKESEQLSPAIGTLLNLGYCWEQLGRLKSAMDAYGEAEVMAGSAADAKRSSFAKERFAAVEKRAPKLVIRLTPQSTPDLEVSRNGVSVAKADLEKPIAIDPEDHVVAASAPGFEPWRSAFLVRGEGTTITIIVPPLTRAAPAPAMAGPAGPIVGVRRIAAIGLGAIGLFAAGAGVAAAVSAKSRYDDSASHCDARGCDATGVDLQERAAAQGNFATALVALGIVSTAAGVYLWIVGAPDRQPHDKTAPAPRAASFQIRPTGVSLGGTF